VVGYVSPQVWAWRAGRVHTAARALDQLLCLWPFEPALYAGTGLDARHVGHPAVERVAASSRESGVLAILPGSREAEVRRHLAPFLAVARASGAREVLLPVASTVAPRWLGALPEPVRACTMDEALARSERALTKSGTSTLELALAGIPAVVAHRVSPWTWALARGLVRGVGHVALPNLLLGEPVQEERLQRLDPAELGHALRRAVAPPVARLRERLRVAGGAAAAAAEAILSRWG
jgi:lipid-A-disaccharide synthase